jgi:hypothetical protein
LLVLMNTAARVSAPGESAGGAGRIQVERIGGCLTLYEHVPHNCNLGAAKREKVQSNLRTYKKPVG